MSLLKAFVAAWIWIAVCSMLGGKISTDILVLSVAIIVAGALAGGDK